MPSCGDARAAGKSHKHGRLCAGLPYWRRFEAARSLWSKSAAATRYQERSSYPGSGRLKPMEFLVYAPLEFKRTVRASLLEAADEDPDYSDVLWRTPRPVDPLRPPFAYTRRDCGSPYRSKGAILALRLAEIWRKSAKEPLQKPSASDRDIMFGRGRLARMGWGR
jgi:hypothetical protein